MDPRDDRTRWRELAPGLGLIAGSALAALVVAVFSGDSGRLAVAIAIGAGIGLVVGAVVRLLGTKR